MNPERPFLIDEMHSSALSYGELYRLSQQETIVFSPIITKTSVREIVIALAASIFCDVPVTVLDLNHPEAESMREFGSGTAHDSLRPYRPESLVRSHAELVAATVNLRNWSITLFTSGTTGLPKKVTHSFSSFSRSVKTGERFGNNIWGLGYHPAHMAGLQVIFQALMNENPLVNLFSQDQEYIRNQIEKHRITHLASTPTFLRMLLGSGGIFKTVIQVTTGGEKFKPRDSDRLQKMFPAARITNVYASTEAGSLFSGEGEIFTINEHLSPFVRIDEGELLIHASLTGKSDSIETEGGWYRTGDLVEVTGEDPRKFRIAARKNEMINVGGYKVNPDELEEQIMELDGITDARVYGRKNSVTGALLACDVICSNETITELTIRSVLKEKLPDYKIPRIIKFVKTIERTRSGKKHRG